MGAHLLVEEHEDHVRRRARGVDRLLYVQQHGQHDARPEGHLVEGEEARRRRGGGEEEQEVEGVAGERAHTSIPSSGNQHCRMSESGRQNEPKATEVTGASIRAPKNMSDR